MPGSLAQGPNETKMLKNADEKAKTKEKCPKTKFEFHLNFKI
jgi:hypothetical protein